ncbi:Protein of unknown function [Butyrivibrio sp. ob235]|uniref:DUF3160 domain-containing protein n=1 Tax=Butyrivibrio sp. ob235 TaxID=1761780 RepID=UPI0008AFD488|nr:DUF3160 domain-containing protein [Butyrivibrio sp. ob235]SEL65199.1 Protein of unknown function [Butyrivibrio sp. ob235]
MKKKVVTILLTLSMVLSGCAGSTTPGNSVSDQTDLGDKAKNSEDTTEAAVDEKTESSDDDASVKNEEPEETTDETTDSQEDEGGSDYDVINLSLLGDKEEIYYDENLVPSIPAYSVAEDFSNVEYHKRFAGLFETEYEDEYNNVTDFRNMLIKNSFAVTESNEDEFFDVYEDNRYDYFPSFVTVDSLMHTYHLYFAFLMKNTEKKFLSDKLMSLTDNMLEITQKQYEELKGTDWEKAAFNNLAFFYIGSLLQGGNNKAPLSDKNFEDIVSVEYDKIMSADGISVCGLTELNEDYSQYKVRGYYEGDEILEKYFRAMMWYGRIPFELESEERVKSAVLMTMAIDEKPEEWADIYSVTSFFAGASDDPGYNVFADLVKTCYGKMPAAADLSSDSSSLDKVVKAAEKLDPPQINSVPAYEDEEVVIPSFRFMGQRFTIDASIMQRLVYRNVQENSNGDNRYLPDTLDTAAVLGSDTAYSILDENGATDYKNYTDNLTVLKGFFSGDNNELWNASLYSGWLNTLRPLFEKKPEGYPSYMLSDEWEKKDLETFAGSYAELKHDTILYAKQIMAEMGGGEDDEDIPDDRGYVDPEPVVYSRFLFLSNKTKEGLKNMGMLESSAEKDLDLLSDMAKKLLDISEKELKNESLSDEDYEFIRCYGGNLEHFWVEVNKDTVEGLAYSYQAPCPIVADIATDPNGSVLEVGTGGADRIYVVFPIDGKLHVGRGSVYSFYQFEVPISDRMTDSEWRGRLNGGYLDDDWNWVEAESTPDKPQWTMSYRVKR